MRARITDREPVLDRAQHFELGARGEALAIDHLERLGYRIVAANFSLPIGRNTRDAIVIAEIDVVAYDGPILCFVEVKTRVSDDFALPQANVDLRKRRQIARARGFDLELVKRVIRMVERSEYKRQQAAPGIKISEKAFGVGRRFPIAAKSEI